MAVAACRFWLLRIDVAAKNQTEQRMTSHVLQKDPHEMRAMVLNRLAIPLQFNV